MDNESIDYRNDRIAEWSPAAASKKAHPYAISSHRASIEKSLGGIFRFKLPTKSPVQLIAVLLKVIKRKY